MSASTQITVRDPVDPRVLFDAMRAAAANSEGRWNLDESCGMGMRMYQTRCDVRHAKAEVAVHFPAGGGLVPRDYLDDPGSDPDGHVLGSFSTEAFAGNETVRAYHAELCQALGVWLAARHLRWSWSIQGEDWIDGSVPVTRGALS